MLINPDSQVRVRKGLGIIETSSCHAVIFFQLCKTEKKINRRLALFYFQWYEILLF